MSNSTCSNDGCEGQLKAFGLCSKHYQRVARSKRPCKFSECSNGGANSKTGFCLTHHNRLIKHGDPARTMKGKHHKVQITLEGSRICKGCGEAKPPTNFHRDGRAPDGYRAQCKPCRKAFMAEYYADNRESRAAYEQDRRTNRSEHMRALDMARYERHKEKRIALASEQVKIRRARLAGVETDPRVTVPALREMHGDNCCYCGVVMSFVRQSRAEGIARNRATLEHIHPISRGGSHTFDNTALACHRCNVSKNSKTVDEWNQVPI